MKNTLLFICSTNNSATFANHKYGELSYPKNPEMCDPIIVNPVVKKGPHPAAHPHLASYKEVPPHPPPPSLGLTTVTQQMQKESCHVRTSLKS